MDPGENGQSSNAPVGCIKETLSVLAAAAAGAYEGSGGIRVAGGRSLCVPRRHHYGCPRYTTRDGGGGPLSRARADREGHTPQSG